MSEVIARPLGKITAILADCGFEVTYAYDDLVFIEHSAFMLQFTDDPAVMKIFRHVDCEPVAAGEAEKTISAAHAKQGFSMLPSGNYTITENEDETINIEFV
ncbi:hypothetical protein [Pontiella agarivorans]|uniref:Uncharacterized protein n=1 Tax=Pontiella agarivorans TaxID=3038953 RepID=A0ABU5MZ39_9BACT|nr:hypothetical protein [Pontiella agarivorans]MDZ8119371.1 hypothetical protein [Pontiella agarivorans]